VHAEVREVVSRRQARRSEFFPRGFDRRLLDDELSAVDPFSRLDRSAADRAEEMQQAMKLARELHPFAQSVADAQTCIERLKPRGPVFITGYCYGGSVTWAVACRTEGLAAASGYYGSVIPNLASETPKCATILHFGRQDQSIPMDAVEKVKAAHPAVPVHIYEAGHGFNGDGSHHNDAAAALAWERTLALFRAAA
jgi:carboxymethylenebutenolidase